MSRNRPLGFPKTMHLRRPADFRRVYDCRCSVSDQLLIAYGCANDLGHVRLGLSVSRKFGNAVKRNRLRRLCREAFRQNRHDFPFGLDVVLIPRSSQEASLADLSQALTTLVPLLAKKLQG